MALPERMIVSDPWRIIGQMLDAPPATRPPHYVMGWLERFYGASWEAAKPLYVDNLCYLLKDNMAWTAAEVARAREQLMELLTEHDRIERLEHDRIPVLRPGPQGRELLEIRRQ
jgi:hypothetical protein